MRFSISPSLSPLRTWVASGQVLAVASLGFSLAAVVPGRVAVALSAETPARAVAEGLAGLALDLRHAYPLFALLAVFLSLAGRRARAVAVALPLQFAVLLAWCVGVGSAEFRLQRGVYPTWFDVSQSFGDGGFYASNLDLILRWRYLVPTLLLSVPLAVWATQLFRVSRTTKTPWRAATACMVAVAAVTIGFFQAHVRCERISPVRLDRESIRSAFDVAFVAGFRRGIANGFQGVRTWVEARPQTLGESGDALERRGRTRLGLPVGPLVGHGPERADACQVHPWSEPLSHIARAPEARGDHAALRDASPHLLADLDSDAPILWHVVLESFRAADIRALGGGAPADLTPTFNGLLEGSHPLSPRFRVVSFREVWQAGVRTSQGLSAATCGLGTLPQGLSFTRDFGLTGARCLPGALRAVGLDPLFLYGATPSFDGMETFFQSQGARTLAGRDIPDDAARGGWGVSDRALFRFAVQTLENETKRQGHYVFVLSLTNHAPYRAPSDVPPPLLASHVDVVKSKRLPLANEDAAARLLTVRYTDLAVGEFLERIANGPLGKRSLVLLQGDHASGEAPVNDGEPSPEAFLSRSHHARVPFVLLFPRADAAKAAPGARTAVRAQGGAEVHTFSQPVSQNDGPRLLLAALSGWERVRQATHVRASLGGQATRGHAVHGYDALSRRFSLDAQGNMVAGEALAPLDFSRPAGADDADDDAVYEALSRIFRNHVTPCAKAHTGVETSTRQ